MRVSFGRKIRKAFRTPKWVLYGFLSLVVVLVAVRLALPWAVKSYVNKTLNSIPGYRGSVDDVGIALWRGAYKIYDLKLVKINGNAQEPFFAVERIDAGIDWRALLHRRVVTRVTIEKPKLQFIVRTAKNASQTSIDASWQEKVADLIPFQINRLLIEDGLVRYEDKTSDPKIDLYFQNLDVAIENISNATRSGAILPSPFVVSSVFLHSGKLHVDGHLNALADPLEVDLKGKVNGLHLKEVNNFTRAYGGFDFEKGDLDVTTEFAASKTDFKGYVKTLAKNVDILDFQKELKEGKPLGNLIWQGAVGAIMAIFKNHGENRFAARVPISGRRSDIKIDKWATVGSILRNTFIRALTPEIEKSVKFADVVSPKEKASVSGTTSASDGSADPKARQHREGKRESTGLHLAPPDKRAPDHR